MRGYTYSWDNGDATATVSDLSGGDHIVYITDSKNCSTSATVHIDEPAVLSASAVQNSAVTCNGAGNGSATVSVTGGNAPYTYSWDNGDATATVSDLSGGDHIVYITDSKNCSTSATVHIDEPAELTASASQNSPVTCSGGSDGSATVTATGGNSGYTYLWDDGETTATATNLNDGPHTVTVTDTKGCSVAASVAITTQPDPAITLSSITGTDNQTVCINNAISDITYAVGGNTDGATVTGLPAGITASFSGGVFTITGTPTEAGIFPYTVTTTGPCVNVSLSGTINVNDNSTIALSSATGTDDQTVCIDNAITDITYAIGGGGTGASITSGTLPDGVTGSFSSGVFTITGTPTEAGTFSYIITTDGPCINTSISGSITVTPDATIMLSSAPGTDLQTVCINTAIDNITYDIGGSGTDANVSGLPDGVSGSYSNGVFTISGTPDVSGSFTYVVTTVGPCEKPTLTGTIIVNANSSIVLTSDPSDTTQTVCINTPITDITYAIDDGATGGHVTGLPTGVAGSYNAGVFTITGTPTQAGTFNYIVTTDGPCQNVSLTGTITVNDNSSLTLTSGAGTDAQTVCINHAINTISYTMGGGATAASITTGSLPNGVTGSFNAGVFTISGTPTQAGSFSYTVTTTGPCVNVSLSGTLKVNDNSTISLSSASGTDAQTVCINNAISDITYSIGGGGTSASITTGALPNGVTGSFSGSVFTISGTPTEAGTFSYTVTTDGPCENVSMSGTITVNDNSTITLTSATGSDAQTVCLNSPVTDITYAIGGGGTGASITNGSLPAGVTGSYSGGVFTITGTPTEAGTFSYTVTTTGPCVNNSLSGTITVNPDAVVNPVANANYCSGTPGSAISFSSPTTGGTITYSWTSSANAGFGTSGTGTIPAFTATNNGTAVINAVVTVTPHLTNNSVTCDGTPTSFTVTVNPSASMNAVSNLTYCANTPGGPINFSSPITGGTVTYTWTSTVNVGFGLNGTGNIGPFIATNGSYSPLIATVTVTPMLNGCTGSPTTFTITVNPNANSGTISGSSIMCTNSTSQLSTNGLSGGSWASSNPAVATVDGSGMVTALSNGSTTISYTVSNICGASTSTFTVTVNPSASAGTITGPSSVCAGSSVLLSSNGNTGGTWLSASPTIASVNSSGLVTGISQGTATIYYFISNSCGSSFTSFNITVNPTANAGTIFGSSSLCAGSSTQLFTTGNSGGTWASSNPSVAIVDNASGSVLGLSPGTIDITYTVAANSCSAGASVAHFTLTINPSGNAGTISGPANVCVGSSILLTTSGSSGGSWISGSPAATVNNFGLVTGVSTGSATIYYFVSNSCGSSFTTYNVTVSPTANAGTISGPTTVCAGSTISLSSNGTLGGSWTSSTGAAIVDGSGTVLGVSAGNTTITYTVTSACATSSATYNITVNALPNAGTISGVASVCAGSATTFSTNGTSGGSWSSSNTAVATVNPASGVVTGVAQGNATITYTITTGCGTASQSAPITVNPVFNAGTISGGSSVCINSNLFLSASGNTGGTWNSNNTNVATIDPATGVVTGVAAGNATITYTLSNGCGTSTATQVVTVNALANAGTISGASTVCSGLSTTFTTNGTSGGTWSSSNTAVATVNASTGVVNGLASGSATITYSVSTSCGTASTSAGITVSSLSDAGTISGPSGVCVASSINLTTSSISTGQWASNSPSVAIVNSSGTVTGMSQGTVTITFTVNGTCGTSVATYSITVNAVPYAGVANGPSGICVGSTIQFTATGGMSGGTWHSTNPARATVDPSTGQVTGVSAGNVIIAYSVSNSCGASTASIPITVNSMPNAGTISGPSAVCQNGTINLSSSGDANGTWSSSNSLVATVNPGNGTVTGVGAGTATIIYTVGSAALCGTSTASHDVTVNPAPNAGTLTGASSVCKGLSTPFTTSGSTGGTWSSSNPAVAPVDAASGVVTGVSAGNATITYTVTTPTCGSATASATITVNPDPNAGTISGPSSVCVNANMILSSNVSGGTWTSSATAVATVDLNSGQVTGMAAGNTTITYTVTTSCGSATATYTVTVNPLPNAGTISGTAFMCVGSSATFTTNGTGGGTWSSTNPSAATVNPTTGAVTAVAAGSTNIIYTATNSCGSASTFTPVTIGAAPNAGTVTGVSSLCVGSNAIFTSNGTGGGTWSSNNTAAAKVDPVTGQVTGMGAGSATISYTVSSSCGSAVSSLNVTITALPDAGTVSGAGTICSGSITTFTSNGASGGTWSSNNNLVATVDQHTGVVTGVGAGSATITYTAINACGTATASAGVTVNSLATAGTVTGASTLCSGSTTAFTSNGNGGGTWSSNNTAAATVNPVTGVVTGMAQGSATISYTVSGSCGSAVSSANITILPAPNAGTINGSSSVCAGSTTAFTTNGDINGTWTSDNPSVATVDPSGVVTGVAGGSTTINYTVTNSCGTTSSTKIITVIPLPNAGTVSGSSSICVNATTTFTSNGLSGGTWSSPDPSVATVDPTTGLVTGIAPGNTTITYTVTTGCGTASASANITVIILPDAGTLSGAATVCVGANTTYTSNGLSGGTWSSATPSVATVDPTTGVVTGVSAGNATITYTFTNSCGTASASQMITVNPQANAGTISGAASVCVGATAIFTSDGLNGGTWNSGDPSIATVDPTTGLVTGIAAGTVSITYTSTTPCGTASASANVNIIVIPNAGTVSGATTLCAGANTTYTSDGQSGGTWSSMTPSVATVDPTSGVVTGVAAGNATITYTITNSCGTSANSKTITVNPLPNAGTVSGAATVCAGANATFSTNGLPGGTWSTGDASIATVNATTGMVTGVAAGTVSITYTSTTPCGTATASANITVIPILTAGTVSGSTTLCIGSNTTYTSNGSAGGTWSSVTPSIATVNPTTGVVTGVAAGNATIVYTVTNSCGTASASQMITVSPSGNPGTLSGASSVCAGSYVTFSRSGGTNGGTWSSSNTSVATVSNSGRVTGVSAGTAVISYSITTGCGTFSATKSISVDAEPGLSVSNLTVSTDPNECSALVTLGSNITATGSPAPTLQYRIGFYPFFSYPISATHTFYRGTTPVTVIATNSCGSVARMFLVTVVDNTPPAITCKPNTTVYTNGSGRYSVHGHEFDATASDGCGVAQLIYSLSGATNDGFERENRSLNNVRLNVGTTTITWRATDVNGNVSTCQTVITVVQAHNGNDPDQPYVQLPGSNQSSASDGSLSVFVAPNPASDHFTLALKSLSNEKVKLTVVDITGRTIQKINDVEPNSNVRVGEQYHPGIYLLQAVQGKQTVIVKLIKEGN